MYASSLAGPVATQALPPPAYQQVITNILSCKLLSSVTPPLLDRPGPLLDRPSPLLDLPGALLDRPSSI